MRLLVRFSDKSCFRFPCIIFGFKLSVNFWLTAHWPLCFWVFCAPCKLCWTSSILNKQLENYTPRYWLKEVKQVGDHYTQKSNQVKEVCPSGMLTEENSGSLTSGAEFLFPVPFQHWIFKVEAVMSATSHAVRAQQGLAVPKGTGN